MRNSAAIFFIICTLACSPEGSPSAAKDDTSTLASRKERAVDPRPLERPQPICNIRAQNVRSLIEFLMQILESDGFKIEQTIWDQGEIRAIRSRGQEMERMVVWLQPDLASPTEKLNLYLVGAHYEPFFGKSEPQRVVLSPRDEDELFGETRRQLIQAARSRG